MLKLSIGKIVDQVMRSGNIDSRFYDAAPIYMGAALHRKIQAGMGDNYQKEVSLKLETAIAGMEVELRGRADGIITDTSGITIDEIKTTTLPLDHKYEQHQMHLAQGKCYAFMYLQTLENPPAQMSVQLTYFHMETEETRRHTWEFSAAELREFFENLLASYGVWLKLEQNWKVTRDASIHELTFPFPSYRKGQRELAVAVYRTISAEKKLYACAPTGIGKTLSSIFPSIKAMGEGKTAPIFYLTAKTVTRTVAEEAVRLMAKGGLRFKSITLRAKDKLCPNQPQCVCNPNACQRAHGHYSRVNAAILDILEKADLMTPAEITEYSARHMVCPHEFTLDIALWCDMVVGDYNHLFHPDAYLRRFFYEPQDYVFLIDEAHNLTDRVRDMYSAEISKNDLSKVLRALRGRDVMTKNLRKAMRSLDAYFADMATDHGNKRAHVADEVDTILLVLIKETAAAMGEWLATQGGNEMHEQMLEAYFGLYKFIMISEIFDEHYCTMAEFYGREVQITLFCLDPSKIIREKLTLGKSAILFSATLTPLPYYRDILGGVGDDNMVMLPSPFEPGNLRLVANTAISTKYRDRDASYAPIAQEIKAVASGGGNYFAFFPSYEYLQNVYDAFTAICTDVEIIVQGKEMTEDERAEFLQKFDETSTTKVAFAVLGGIFSEGIDLVGDKLVGAIIVGVGLPKISLRQDLIKNYFNQSNSRGYDYAYVFPGMNKVLQAAGRVIRTETDTGTVVLIDSRYRTREYRALLPAHWSGITFVD